MKKLLAILLMGALFVPTATRLVCYVQCTLQSTDGPPCDCNLSGTSTDQNTPLPEKQKELVEQTDVKYIAAENGLAFLSTPVKKIFAVQAPSFYCFTAVSTVFHPPGVLLSIS